MSLSVPLPGELRSWHYLLALLAGGIFVFAFAPFEQRWVVWLSIILFFWLNLAEMTVWQRMRLSWVYGIGLFAAGAHWIYVSIHFFGGANSLIAIVMVSIFAMIVGAMLLFFALAHWFRSLSMAQGLLLVFPAMWWLVEWLRAWLVLGGFPWLQAGHAQIDTVLMGYAPIIGSLGISWIVALQAGAILLLLLGDMRERVVSIMLLVVTFQAGYLLQGMPWTEPVDEPLYVSMVQGNLKQEDKWKPELRNDHVRKHIDLGAEHFSNSHVLIWPETGLPDYFQRSMEDVVFPIQDAAAEHGTDVLMGGFHYDEFKEHTYNAILRISDDLDFYGKRHLVPFSEYIPLLEYIRWAEAFIKLPYDNVNAWEGNFNLTVAGQPMRMSVCYEDAYGAEMTQGLPEATMLVNISNDGWFTGSVEPQQHAEIARMRALETGRYLLRATNNGQSQIVNHFGQVVATAPQYVESVIAGWAQPMQGATPYVIWGNRLMVIVIGLLLLLLVFMVRRQTSQETKA